MKLRNFLTISIAIHLAAAVILYLVPAPQVRKTKEFFTQLVTPEQTRRHEPPPPIKVPLPASPQKQEKIPVRPKIPYRVKPTPDRPVVPGTGKDEGRPLPEGIIPKTGKGTAAGGEGGKEEVSNKPGYLDAGKAKGKPDITGRQRLFDPEIIGEAAKKGEGTKGKKDDAITFDTKEYRYAGYMRKLKEKIESIWEYPPEARARKLYGDLKLRFTIKKDGRIGSIELVRTSGYKSLDDAAIKALKDGEPFWPLPDEWGMESYTILGHFVYTMYGYGIR